MSLVFFHRRYQALQNWRPWRYFYADKYGIHFPSECPGTKNTEWLSVPWDRTGRIRKETFLNRTKGPSIELSIDDEDIERFFKDVKLTRMFFDRAIREQGYFTVGYTNAFEPADRAVGILNDFKNPP